MNNYSTNQKTDTSSSNDKIKNISNYSSTAIEVASSVLPSIVGIEVQYNVSSFGETVKHQLLVQV